MTRYGYARVSTREQNPDSQQDALAAAGIEPGMNGDADGDGGFPVVEQRHVDPDKDVGRNDPCWCGSGKKYKKCHGA